MEQSSSRAQGPPESLLFTARHPAPCCRRFHHPQPGAPSAWFLIPAFLPAPLPWYLFQFNVLGPEASPGTFASRPIAARVCSVPCRKASAETKHLELMAEASVLLLIIIDHFKPELQH